MSAGVGMRDMRLGVLPPIRPQDLAIGVLSAVQGGLLLAKTSRSEGPLKVALDMALGHVASHKAMRRRR
jgi:hypothetical protein